MGMGEGSCKSGSNVALLAPPLCALSPALAAHKTWLLRACSRSGQSAARRAAQPDPLLSAIVVAVEATRVSKRNLGCAALQQP